MSGDILRSSAIRAGYDRRFDDLIRILGWKRSTFYKRLADPDTATVAELREFCQATGMSAAEVAELIGGKKWMRESWSLNAPKK